MALRRQQQLLLVVVAGWACTLEAAAWPRPHMRSRSRRPWLRRAHRAAQLLLGASNRSEPASGLPQLLQEQRQQAAVDYLAWALCVPPLQRCLRRGRDRGRAADPLQPPSPA